eukprot:g866.t1
MKSEALSQAAGVTGAAASNAQLDSATSAGHLEEGYDFFTAVDETAVRLFSQMLKPLNTAVSHWDGISNFVAGSSDHDQEVLKRAVKTMVKFSEDSQSSSSDMHVKLKLGGGKKLVLPMGHVPPGAVHALVKGLHSASQRGPSCGVANWDDLRVFEVETFHVVSKTWRTPNWGSMIETETSWRWLDSTLEPPVRVDRGECHQWSLTRVSTSRTRHGKWTETKAMMTAGVMALPGTPRPGSLHLGLSISFAAGAGLGRAELSAFNEPLSTIEVEMSDAPEKLVNALCCAGLPACLQKEVVLEATQEPVQG